MKIYMEIYLTIFNGLTIVILALFTLSILIIIEMTYKFITTKLININMVILLLITIFWLTISLITWHYYF